MSYTRADIVVCMGTDLRFSASAIWEIVQPFADPQVGAVSASVEAWNAFHNLCTWLQAYEYHQTIFMGRQLSERLGGWDVGPGEDGDIMLRIRRWGYRIAAAPLPGERPDHLDATVSSASPLGSLGGHLRMPQASRSDVFWQRHFRWANLEVFLERWFFNIYCLFGWWAYGIWLCVLFAKGVGHLAMLLYLCLLVFELVQALLMLSYSRTPGRDLLISGVLPFYPLYQAFLKTADAVAVVEELLFRRSKQDNFVPAKVRDVTWHW